MKEFEIKLHAFFDKMPSESRSSAEIRGLLPFQEKQASIKDELLAASRLKSYLAMTMCGELGVFFPISVLLKLNKVLPVDGRA